MTRNPHHRYVPERQPEPAPQKSHEQIEQEAAVAYLADQRALAGTRQAQGMDAFSYMPTTIGNVMAGYVAIADLTEDEVRWWADEYHRQLHVSEGMGDAQGVVDARKMITLATDELARRGVFYQAPAAPQPFVSPPPPHDPSRGR